MLTLNLAPLRDAAVFPAPHPEYVSVVPFNRADLLLTAVESTQWDLSCIVLKFKQGLVIHNNNCNDEHGSHGHITC